jgi:hypothetical protein
LLGLKHDGLALLWIEGTESLGSGSTLKIAISHDDGLSWRNVSSRPVDNDGEMSAIADDQGRVHVIMAGASRSPSAPIHQVWDGKSWTEAAPALRQGYVVPTPALASIGPDSLIAFWGSAESQRHIPVTLYSVGVAVCRRSNRDGRDTRRAEQRHWAREPLGA